MESLKEYRPSIINKLKLFLSRIEQRKTIEKDLYPAFNNITKTITLATYLTILIPPEIINFSFPLIIPVKRSLNIVIEIFY